MKSKTVILITLLFLVGGLSTYAMPLIKVEVPPVVKEQWSAWSMTKSLPQMATKKESKWDAVKIDFDFMDVLVKILPKKEETGEGKKFSLTFLLGILVPVALMATYILLLLAFFVLLLRWTALLSFFSFLMMLTSLYSLVGTYYLGWRAQLAFQSAVEAKAGGFLGGVTKHMVREISLTPDWGLYLLFVFAFLIFIMSFLKARKVS